MTFLIQTINHKIVHDFSFELERSIDFFNFYNREISVEYTNDLNFTNKFKDFIPVGNVEFVNSFFKHFFQKEINPFKIPSDFEKFLGGELIEGNESISSKLNQDKNYFIKSTEFLKSGVFHSSENFFLKPGNYQAYEEFDIESEYRIFVFNNEIVGMKHYLGNFEIIPDLTELKKTIKFSKQLPPACTIDVGITKDLFPKIIEIHHFFSCGLYGFSNYNIYPYMLSNWFYWMTKK